MHRCRPRSRTDRSTLALTLLPAVTAALAAVGVSLAMLLLLPSRGNAQAANDTADAGSDEPPARIATARLDFDADGVADTLSLVMTAGRVYEDTVEWCGRGEKFEGEFAVRIALAGGSTTERALDGYEFFRAGDSTLAFADYDGDGRLDFNLGQYASCNGWRYRLYAVEPSGRVRELPVAGHASGIPVSDFANSTKQLVPTDGGFGQCFYHTERGHLLRRYRWDAGDGRFSLEEERAVERCRTRVRRTPPDSTPEAAARAYLAALRAGAWRAAARLVDSAVAAKMRMRIASGHEFRSAADTMSPEHLMKSNPSMSREDAGRVLESLRLERRHQDLSLRVKGVTSVEELEALELDEFVARVLESQTIRGRADRLRSRRETRVVGAAVSGDRATVVYHQRFRHSAEGRKATSGIDRPPRLLLSLRRIEDGWRITSRSGVDVGGAPLPPLGDGTHRIGRQGRFCVPWSDPSDARQTVTSAAALPATPADPESAARLFLNALSEREWDSAAEALHPDLAAEYGRRTVALYRYYATTGDVTVEEYRSVDPAASAERARRAVEWINRALAMQRKQHRVKEKFAGVETGEALEALAPAELMSRAFQGEHERFRTLLGSDGRPRRIAELHGVVQDGDWAEVVFGWRYEWARDEGATTEDERTGPTGVLTMRRTESGWRVGAPSTGAFDALRGLYHVSDVQAFFAPGIVIWTPTGVPCPPFDGETAPMP